MDNSDSTKLKDILSAIDPVEFAWDETNTSIGIVAQEIGPIDLSNYAVTNGAGLAIGHASVASSNSWANGSTISFAGSNSFHADTTEYSKNTIKTAKNTIDIDELAVMMETLKKRLLILTPKFEQLEKYPMLKAAYDEFKMLEKLLGEPDDTK